MVATLKTQGEMARLTFGLTNSSKDNKGLPAAITVNARVKVYQGSALFLHGALEADFLPIAVTLPAGYSTWILDISTQGLSTGGQIGYEGYKDIGLVLTLPNGQEVSQEWDDALKVIPAYVPPVYDVSFGPLDIF